MNTQDLLTRVGIRYNTKTRVPNNKNDLQRSKTCTDVHTHGGNNVKVRNKEKVLQSELKIESIVE